MARYIDADKIIKYLDSIKELSELEGKFNEWQYARYIIKSSETEDVEPIIHGKWLVEQEYTARNCRNYKYYKCSVCGREVLISDNPSEYFPYCNCGAKMKENEE